MQEDAVYPLREVLQWAKTVLPWAALGIGGGALRALDPEHRVTFKGAIGVLVRSTIVGVLVGLVTGDFSFRLGTRVLLIVFCAFGADTVLAIAGEIWSRIRANPWTVLRWVKGRTTGPEEPPELPPDRRSPP